MARTLAIIACFLAASALLGTAFASPPSPPGPLGFEGPDEGAQPGPSSKTYFVEGNVVVELSVPNGVAMSGAGTSGALDVEVPTGAKAIVVELRYATMGLAGLVLYVGDPAGSWSNVPPADATTPGLQQLLIEAPSEGTWSAMAFAESIAVNTEYSIAFTVFYGEVPAGFTAFE